MPLEGRHLTTASVIQVPTRSFHFVGPLVIDCGGTMVSGWCIKMNLLQVDKTRSLVGSLSGRMENSDFKPRGRKPQKKNLPDNLPDSR